MRGALVWSWNLPNRMENVIIDSGFDRSSERMKRVNVGGEASGIQFAVNQITAAFPKKGILCLLGGM